jgi:3-dehydroquinate synthase
VFKLYSVDFISSTDELFELQKRSDVYFVIDKKVYGLYRERLPDFEERQLFLLETLELNKNIDMVLCICEKMIQLESKRNILLVSVGGGIVQDVTGFVANVLYRGIRWLYMPTTLLASCDSCIGGKSSLNYGNFKNLLGSFYPPDRIGIYPGFFMTLSDVDYCSGIGEIIKFSIISGRKNISDIETKMAKLLSRNGAELIYFIDYSLNFKKKFVEEDEFDRGKRKLLNYGHTFGHAFENTSLYNIPHGSAVVLGILVANAISLARGIIDKELSNNIGNICKRIVFPHLKKEWFKLDNIIAAMKKDKKQTGSSINAILLKNDCLLDFYDDVKVEEIRDAVIYLLDFFDIK